MNHTHKPDPLYIITGLSGAGLSSALKILEDDDCEIFDNFPLGFLPTLLNDHQQGTRPIALGIDTRTRNFDPTLVIAMMEQLKADKRFDVTTFFLTADDAVLLKRFTDTRRTHPLARDRAVADGIAAEKSLLYPLKYKSDVLIDTSDLSIHDLRRVLEGHIAGKVHKKLQITVMSFAYRHGVPREADLVFDVRFLRNPHWERPLRDKTGKDVAVQQFIAEDDMFRPFEDQVRGLLELLLPRYEREGKNYLTISFGCTGGQHRSVFLAERFAGWLEEKNFAPQLHHREIKGG
jgi:RNase adapter protein RapZ